MIVTPSGVVIGVPTTVLTLTICWIFSIEEVSISETLLLPFISDTAFSQNLVTRRWAAPV